MQISIRTQVRTIFLGFVLVFSLIHVQIIHNTHVQIYIDIDYMDMCHKNVRLFYLFIWGSVFFILILCLHCISVFIQSFLSTLKKNLEYFSITSTSIHSLNHFYAFSQSFISIIAYETKYYTMVYSPWPMANK